MPLLLEISRNMYIVTICCPACGIINFEIDLRVFPILFKQASMNFFHIVEPLIEILYLVLASFKLVLDFEMFKFDDLVE